MTPSGSYRRLGKILILVTEVILFIILLGFQYAVYTF